VAKRCLIVSYPRRSRAAVALEAAVRQQLGIAIAAVLPARQERIDRLFGELTEVVALQ
jgi:hypothetical protein